MVGVRRVIVSVSDHDALGGLRDPFFIHLPLDLDVADVPKLDEMFRAKLANIIVE